MRKAIARGMGPYLLGVKEIDGTCDLCNVLVPSHTRPGIGFRA